MSPRKLFVFAPALFLLWAVPGSAKENQQHSVSQQRQLSSVIFSQALKNPVSLAPAWHIHADAFAKSKKQPKKTAVLSIGSVGAISDQFAPPLRRNVRYSQ